MDYFTIKIVHQGAVYIALGMVALKATRPLPVRVAAWLAALATVG